MTILGNPDKNCVCVCVCTSMLKHIHIHMCTSPRMSVKVRGQSWMLSVSPTPLGQVTPLLALHGLWEINKIQVCMFPQQALSSLSNSPAHDKTLDHNVMLGCGKKILRDSAWSFTKCRLLTFTPIISPVV